MKVLSRSRLFSAAMAFAPLLAGAQAAPTAQEVFARHVTAIGGKDAIMKISSIKTVGTMAIPSMGLTATMETFAAAPNRTASKTTIPGIGEILTGFDGSVAWEVNPMQGPRVKSDKEMLSAKDDADFYGSMLYAAERYTSAETVGQVDFAGEKAWQVKSVFKSGRTVHEYFSVASGLKIGSKVTQDGPSGSLDIVTVESEYKQFGTVKVATKEEATAGPTKIIRTVTDVVFGDVPASAFALPAPVKALVAKAP